MPSSSSLARAERASSSPIPTSRAITAVKALERGVTVALTADVPKVARKAGLGIVMLAKQSGRPIVPVAIATRRRIDLKSWDKASVNLPFSKGAVVAGHPIWVPADADAAALEVWRQRVEAEMNRATERAYAIAEGRAKPEPWPAAVEEELAAAREAALTRPRPFPAEGATHA